MNYQQLKQTLNTIQKTQHRTLLKTIYAGCARVGEIVRHRYNPQHNPPLTRQQIQTTPSFLILNIKTEKNNRPRAVPISRTNNPEHEFYKNSEAWLTEDILAYAKQHSPLFNYSVRWAQNKFKEHFPENHIHELRHWRASHLLSGEATGVPLPERIVARHGGWQGTAVLTKVYDATNIATDIGINEYEQREALL